MFQTPLVNQSLVLSSLTIHKSCDESRRHLFSSCCDLSSMRTWSPCLIIILCFVWSFLLDRKTLHHSVIQSSWRAVQESSSGVCLKASLSFWCVPSYLQVEAPSSLIENPGFKMCVYPFQSYKWPWSRFGAINSYMQC